MARPKVATYVMPAWYHRHRQLLTAVIWRRWVRRHDYSHNCPASLEQLLPLPALRQLSDPFYKLTKTSPLALSPAALSLQT